MSAAILNLILATVPDIVISAEFIFPATLRFITLNLVKNSHNKGNMSFLMNHVIRFLQYMITSIKNYDRVKLERV